LNSAVISIFEAREVIFSSTPPDRAGHHRRLL
jgi:hypothetical protein